MRTITTLLVAAVLVFITGGAFAGEGHQHKHGKKIIDKAKGKAAPEKLVVCSECGELKGSEKCCDAKAEKCDKCELNKGSVGCCRDLKPAKSEKEVYTCPMHPQIKMSKPGKCTKCGMALVKEEKEIVLCPKCGHVEGTDKCCVKDAEKCKKCGLSKDAPGCCKIPAKPKS